MLARRLALACGLFLGIVASQGPEFGQQYRQRLGGAIDELNRVVARFDKDAADSGYSEADALAHMQNSSDSLMRRQGKSMEKTITRFRSLLAQQQAFDHSGKFGRLLVLLERADPSLLRTTFHDFEPAVPVTSEGFVFGGIGFVSGWLATMLATLPFGRRRRRRIEATAP
jgi:hypothetical protein